MVTLCEGVETKEQYEFLQSIGCDKAQGYCFDKPLPREEILAKYLAPKKD
jgi:EAL domain-containing protein (putative c-di-GMP-specific phosphodiesterase class I)